MKNETDTRFKLRLKDASGAEFEAEGTMDFVQSEKALFLDSVRRDTKTDPGTAKTAPGRAREQQRGRPADAFWDRIISLDNDAVKLRFKSPAIKAAEAALILLAANRALNADNDMPAIGLAKALRASGYQPHRLDRLLNGALKTGKITASGTKRNRYYGITAKGLEKLYGSITKLTGSEEAP